VVLSLRIRLRALDDDSSWEEAQALFALWEPDWAGDAGESLARQQDVFARAIENVDPVRPVAPLTKGAAEVFRLLAASGRRGRLVGGMAVQRWGEPRATQDGDVTVLAPFGFVRRQLGRLDLDRIRRWRLEFAEVKEDPDLLAPFEAALIQARR
jgi:hypothetical protein